MTALVMELAKRLWESVVKATVRSSALWLANRIITSLGPRHQMTPQGKTHNSTSVITESSEVTLMTVEGTIITVKKTKTHSRWMGMKLITQTGPAKGDIRILRESMDNQGYVLLCYYY